MFVLNFFFLFLINVNKSEQSFTNKNQYHCVTKGTVCTFSNVILTPTDYEWEPTADDPSKISKLIFLNCTIPVLTKSICETFPMLEALYMEKLGVKIVNENAFHNCSKLVNLHLNENEIAKLHPSTFLYSRNLERLVLVGNRISQIDNHFNMLPNLTYLTLGNNSLSFFSPEFVKYNKKLANLNLYTNDLTDLAVEKLVEYLPSLVVCNINYNEFLCERVFNIYKMFSRMGIRYNFDKSDYHYYKVRYHPQLTINENQMCNADLEWLAVKHRSTRKIFMEIKKKQKEFKRRLYQYEINVESIGSQLMEAMKQRTAWIKAMGEKF